MKRKNIFNPSLRGEQSDRRELCSRKQSLRRTHEIASSELQWRSPLKFLLAMTMVMAILSGIALSGCDEPIQSQYFEQITVASFIYANEAIDSVVLHRTTPFGDYYDDLDYAVDSATVIVTSNGVADTLL